MLKASLVAATGLLSSTNGETSSYLDSINPATDVYSSNGWKTNRAGDILVNGDFYSLDVHTVENSVETYIRVDLRQSVMISSIYLSNRNNYGTTDKRLIEHTIYLSSSNDVT